MALSSTPEGGTKLSTGGLFNWHIRVWPAYSVPSARHIRFLS